MTPRRESKKMNKSAQRNRKDVPPESSEDSDDSSNDSQPPPLITSESESDSEDENEKIGKWWLRMNEEEKKKRKTCMKIHLLSPFLYGVVPPGHEDKLIDWSYECGLLLTKDVQQVALPANKTFEAIQIVENAFEVLEDCKGKKAKVPHIIGLKNDIVKMSNCKSALECAEAKAWFTARRSSIRLPPDGKKDMASMALLLAVYHFAGHIQLSYNKNTDVLKRFNEDCKLAEEKALEIKEQGNEEFANDNYRAAISRYTRAVGLSPFNYIMYGNRAQSYQNVKEYRQALIDAKRAVILKPEWAKGQYRFKQAANALYNSEGDNASFLTFCVDEEVLTAKNGPKQNGAQAVKKENPETSKGANQKSEDDSGEGSVPELVSADESDTSGDSDTEPRTKLDMPDLVEEDASDSNESGADEDVYSKIAAATKKHLLDNWESKRSKKWSKSTLELLRKHNEELLKKELEKEPEQKRVPEKKPEKVEKPKKTKEVNNVEKPVSLPERKTQIEGILREGSKALLDNSFQEAYESYTKALGFIDTGPRKSLGYGDKKYVIVLYACGTALVGLDVHKELEAAKSTFQNIITSFKSTNFPLAYYGLGRVHHRQNRFPEAIEVLEKGLDIIQNKSFEKIYWPGTDIVIEETKAGNLKVSFERILTICKYPPKPDAICRFDNCTGEKKSIYLNDTDYKGYVRIMCTDACIVEYHIHCWKKLKSGYTDKSTEKDFLDSSCFTVDCVGHISTIQVYDTDGLKTTAHSEKPKSKKDVKPEKVTTTESTAGTKKKKRSKKKDKDFVNEVEMKQNDVGIQEEPKYDVPDEKPSAAPQQEEKEAMKDANVVTEDLKDLSKIPESGMFVLKKNEDEQATLPTKPSKGKSKKKKTKNVQSLDEFLGPDNDTLRLRPFQHDDEDYDEIPSEPFSRLPPEGWMSDPFSIPAHLQNEAREIESSLAAYSHSDMYPSNDPWKTDSIREYVYSAFISLLKVEGAMPVMSAPMRRLLNAMPEEARILVQKEGGLRDFLEQSCLFTFEADIVRNFEDKLITDLSKPYKKAQDPQFPNMTSKENGVQGSENITTSDSFNFSTSTTAKFGPIGSRTNVADSLQLVKNSKIDNQLPDIPNVQNQASAVYGSGVNKESGTVNNSAKTDTWLEKGSSLLKHLDQWAKKFEFIESHLEISNKSAASVDVRSSEIGEMADSTKSGESNGGNLLEESIGEKVLEESIGKKESCEKFVNTHTNETVKQIVNDETLDRIQSSVNESTEEAVEAIKMKEDHAVNCSEEAIEAIKMKEDHAVKSSSAETLKKSNESSDMAMLIDKPVLKDESKNTENIKTTNIESTACALSDTDVIVSENKNKKTNLENKRIPSPVPITIPAAKESSALEIKFTKEKGIQSKPSTKNKMIMTEAMNEPYKVEYEKLLRSCQSWEGKYQELLDKKMQMEKKYNVDVVNLEKKLQDCGRKIEGLGKQCHQIEKHHDHDLQTLRQEKLEKIEQIRKLQEQLSSMSKSDEMQIQALKGELSSLESQHQKEKQQWISEKENNEKLKLYSQQQAKRANNAEIQLLELQRDVNFIFFTRALQEAEITLHNIGQILTVNSTPQLQEISKKWHRYIADCKLQMGRNKAMFEASIPQLKEGKPLSSLISLRIARPAAYPGPPIFHLPPGNIPNLGNKPIPGPSNIRPEANRGPSPTFSGASSSQATPAAVGRADGVRPSGAQTLPPNQTSNTNPGAAAAEPNLKKGTEPPQKGSNSFEKIMMRLSTLFPNYSRTQMTNFIKEVRASKNGSLTGLSFDDIVACVTKLVKARERQVVQNVVPGPPSDPAKAASGFSGPKAPGALPKSTVTLARSVSMPNPVRPLVSVPPVLPVKSVEASAGVVGASVVGAGANVPSQACGNVIYEDDPCVICHDEMTKTTKNVSLDCGHTFHHDCIKKWLTGEQSTCPTCRVHALLPEEFPQLK